jgi:organic hydroperoxide reductase OsmC/OhrA
MDKGPGKPGAATPEHLFAAGYAACFGGALDFVAKRQKKDASKAKPSSRPWPRKRTSRSARTRTPRATTSTFSSR